MLSRILAVALLLAGFWCLGQQEGRGQLLGVMKTPSAAGGCSQATTFLARASGGINSSAYTTFICGMVTDGLITGSLSGARGCGAPFDAIFVFATDSAADAALNICGTSYSLTSTGSTFTANSGYVSTGAAVYVSSNFNPTTATSPNYVQNSAHLSVWDAAITDGGRQVGSDLAGNSGNAHIHANFSGSAFFRIGDPGAAGAANGGKSGLYFGNRSGASAWQGYNDCTGTQLVSGTDASVTPDNSTMAWPDSGTTSADLIRAGSIGGSVSASNEAKFCTRLTTLITATHGSAP